MASNQKNLDAEVGSFTVKSGLAQMLKGGVIMDVVSVEHAVIAEEAGAVAVMALERVPADIREHGGVARGHHEVETGEPHRARGEGGGTERCPGGRLEPERLPVRVELGRGVRPDRLVREGERGERLGRGVQTGRNVRVRRRARVRPVVTHRSAALT